MAGVSGLESDWRSRHPICLGICLYLFFLTTTATFLYLEQMRLVSEQIPSPEGRTRLFALIDLVVNVFTFLTQVTVTSRVISRFGLASALVVLPVASAIGFGVIAVMPLLTVFIIFTIVRRVGEYALAKPAREVLFTVLSREEKYKAKNFIDTAVSRGGDAATGWMVNGVKALECHGRADGMGAGSHWRCSGDGWGGSWPDRKRG